MIILDIETTGLDYFKNNILEVAMIHETFDRKPEELDNLTVRVKWDRVVMDCAIIEMHQTLIKQINEAAVDTKYRDSGRLYVKEEDLIPTLNKWLERRDDVFACGKNVAGFDLPWLRYVATKWGQELFGFKHRCLDLGSVYFTPQRGIPAMSEILKEIGVQSSGLHTAYGDALDCVKALRHKFFGGIDGTIEETPVPCRRNKRTRRASVANA